MQTTRASHRLLVLAMLGISLLVVACGGGSGSDDDAGAGDEQQVNAARDLFAAKGCAECHGADGEGTDTATTPLAGTRMIIQQFQTRVRNGRGSEMPAYPSDQISDDEIRTIYDWLRGME